MSPKHASYTLPIEKVRVGPRHRKDLGDLTALVESIKALGLLNPITVTEGDRLVAGRRRLEAAKRAGSKTIHVRNVSTLADATAALAAERDENLHRKDMLPSEWLSLGAELEKLAKPQAEAALRAGNVKGGQVTAQARGELESIADRARKGDHRRQGHEVRDVVGAQLGVSGDTYQRAKRVREATESDDPAVRQVAEEAMREMDQTGRVYPAFLRVKRARGDTQKRAPALDSRFAGWDRSTKRFQSAVAKERERAWSSLGALEGGTEYLAEKIDTPILVETLTPSELDEMEKSARASRKRIGQFLKRLERAREYPNGKAQNDGADTAA